MALVFSPTTGVYVDPSTGQVFHDAAGTVPSTDPGLTDQARRSLGISNQLFASLAQYGQQYQQAQNGQNAVGAYLQRIISGAAPSVAGTQLQQGLDTIKSGVQSQASGATGVNQPLANYGAIQAYGDAAAKANAAAATERAQEQGQAVSQLGALRAGQAGQALQGAGQSIQGGNQAAGIAATTQGNQAQLDQQNKMAWLSFIGNLANGAGAAGIKAAAG